MTDIVASPASTRRTNLPTPGDVQEGGAQAEAVFPLYVVPTTAAYYTPTPIQKIQAFRDRFGIRTLFVEFIAAFFFTFLLIMPASGLILDPNPFYPTVQLSNYTVTLFCLAFAVAFAVYIAAPHSGAFFSPAATVAFAIFRGFPWKYVPFYLVAQWLGSFIAGVFCYALVAPRLAQIDSGNRNNSPATAAIFVNLPSETIPIGHLFFAELLGGAIFFFVVFGLIDVRNPLINPQLAPLFIGLAVFMVAGAFGWYGFVLNPFRDFAVRVYISHHYDQDRFGSGVNKSIFSYHNHYSMIALFVPFLSHIVGAAFYDLFVNQRYVSTREAPARLGLSEGHIKANQIPGTLNHPTPTHTGPLPGSAPGTAVPVTAVPVTTTPQPYV